MLKKTSKGTHNILRIALPEPGQRSVREAKNLFDRQKGKKDKEGSVEGRCSHYIEELENNQDISF